MTQVPDLIDLKLPEPKRLLWIGIAFAVAGVAAILLPGAAAIAAELLIAWSLLFWGILGLGFAWALRPHPQWKAVGLLFALVLLLGMVLVVSPFAGIRFLTILLIATFLMEGVLSVSLGLRLGSDMPGRGWLIGSGICAFVLGCLTLIGWPSSAAWLLGTVVGVNFLTTGVALIFISRAGSGR